ncbi:MAG: outer membrane lipid asymmetry maintenance protein MlaD [Alphaproteobacteria bacterium]
MGRNIIETVLGAVVLLAAGFFLTFAFKSADLNKVKGYTVTANFPRADGLKTGGDVMINGVKVGTIMGQELMTEPGRNQFMVKVTMSIADNVLLPTDTVGVIANESLLGGRYLSLEIGVEEDNIKTDGTGRITHTQPPIRLDDLIGQLVFGGKGGDKKSAPAGNPASTSSDVPPPPNDAAAKIDLPEHP